MSQGTTQVCGVIFITVLDKEVEESETKRYFLSLLGLIYLFNCLIIQSTHQVEGLD